MQLGAPMPKEPSPAPAVLAAFAHPDDIEFVAAGTLLLLRAAGWQTHYLNLTGGDCGSMTTDRMVCVPALDAPSNGVLRRVVYSTYCNNRF